jgi:ribosomal protein L17
MYDEEDQDRGNDVVENIDEQENDAVEASQEKEEKHYIPKERFDEVNNRMKDAERRQVWLEQQLEGLIHERNNIPVQPVVKEPDYDFDTAEEKYAELLISGELDEAKKLRREINLKQQESIAARMSALENRLVQEAEARVKGLTEDERANIVIENAKSKYSVLDDTSSDFNQDLVNDINALASGYIQRGDNKAKAIEKAIGKLITPKSRTSLGANRLEAARNAPRRLDGRTSTANSLDDVDVARLSRKDFRELSSREKAILRGDNLA